MVEFGKKLSAQKRDSPWAPYYLDYGLLKAVLEDHHHAEDNVSVTSSAVSVDLSVASRLLPPGTHPVTVEFLYHLHSQVEKVLLFVLQEQGSVAAQLAKCRATAFNSLQVSCPPQQQRDESLDVGGDYTTTTSGTSASLVASDAELLRSLEEQYCAAGLHLLQLYRFVEINVTAIRKILKKHDKLLKIKLSPSFFSSSRVARGKNHHESSPRHSPFRQQQRLTAKEYGNLLVKPLLQDNDLAALTVTLEAGLDDLLQHIMSSSQQPQTSNKNDIARSRPPPIGHYRNNTAPDVFQDLENTTYSPGGVGTSLAPRRPPPPPLTGGRVASVSNAIQSVKVHDRKTSVSRGYSLDHQVATFISNTDRILLRIHAAQRRFHQTSEFVQLLAAPMMMTSDSMEDDGSQGDYKDEAAEDDERPLDTLSNTLNLLSTFLYMTNYYIVAPTSGRYAEKLGGDKSLASIIIGMTPIAALVSTILYSWWTSHSYKSALIFASTCSAIGNLCYAAGLPCNSLTLVMIGRLLNGFGSARSINRRYIADTFSHEERTAASAAFVTAGALGMSAGPAFASFLHFITTDQNGIELNNNAYWQAENAPGWFMFVIWSAYLICLICYFTDPPKRETTVAKTLSAPTVEMMSSGEQKPLLEDRSTSVLSSIHSTASSAVVADPPIWRNIPVTTTFFIYFVLKLVLETVLSATALVTPFYFGWHSGVMGMYLALLGLLMLPANLVVSYLAQSYNDRELIMGLQTVVFLGCLAILQYTDIYPLSQYIMFSIVLFVSTNALEGPNMSLLSKTIPKSWSRGVFNVGLLATEAGTLGRAGGDVLLSVFASGGVEHLLNRAYGSFAALSFISLAISYHYYDYLQSSDKDD